MSLSLLGFLSTFALLAAALAYSAVYLLKETDPEKKRVRELSDKAKLAFTILRKESSSPDEARTGFELAMEAARGGVHLGIKVVMASYFFGRGVQRDFARAREWAQKLAELGDSSGKWVYIEAFMRDPDNTCIDPESSETNAEKYRRLCGRSIEQRADEIRAIDYGAELMTKSRPAELFIASLLWSHPAAGNNEAALKILEKFTPESKPKIAVLTYLTGLGSTIATYRIFHDTWPAVSTCAALRADAPEGCDIELKSADALGPVRDAVYLPLKSRKLRDRILVKGTWDERWTFSVHGRDVPVEITFKADGMGGAGHTIKDPAGSRHM